MKENLLPYYPSYYINEDGTEVYRKNSFISSKGKIYQKNKGSDWYKLRIKVCSDGRPKVNLWKDNHRVKVRIQRLVALAWIPNPENKPYVCHKDNNPLNNRVSNLYWGTPRDNTQQCIRDGRFPFRKKKKVDENKLIYQYNIGIPRKDILEEFRISTKLLYSILRKHNVKLRKS